MKGAFRLIGLDEGEVKGAPDRLRLVCITESGGKLAIWGRDGMRGNIDAVLEAGIPCTVECEYRPPSEVHREKFGHTHWVPEQAKLEVVVD